MKDETQEKGLIDLIQDSLQQALDYMPENAMYAGFYLGRVDAYLELAKQHLNESDE